jgi:microcystin degradation protein MlrC
MPIVASFDLHGILTDRILQHCDAITVFHTYPHVDFYDTGSRAARLLLRIARGEVKPVTAKIFIPALVRGDELITATGQIGFAVRAAQAFESTPGGLAAGLFWGNPFTDVAALGTNSFATSDNDARLASEGASTIASLFWEHHAAMQVLLTSIAEAVHLAQHTAGTTILVDAADATSSGAPGDSNAILKELLACGYNGSALIPIVDPAAVRAAFESGVGSNLRVPVGGAFDRQRFQPVEVQGQVRMLTDGRIESESYGEKWYAGDTALLQVGGISLIITSRAVSLYDRSLFYAHGCDPKRFNTVVVKSPHCQPHMFKDWASCYIDVDAPGATSANLRSLGHTRCPRPIFPLDDNVTFTPQVKLLQRGTPPRSI